MSLFKKASRTNTKLRMAITGPSGCGKTYGALLIAKGLVGPEGKIALIDTENSSASYYADKFNFDTAAMNPPYTIDKYIKAITEAQELGYDCIIVDSLSHAWNGEGGILQQKETLDQRPNSNSYTNWGKLTPQQNKLVSTVLHAPTNIICTMRAKTEYILTQNEKGKLAPQKVGLTPIQRDGFEYEFDVFVDIDLETQHATASKDRLSLFPKTPFLITENAGAAVRKWQLSAPQQAQTEQIQKPDKVVEDTKTIINNSTNVISDDQRIRLFSIAKTNGYTEADIKTYLKEYCGIESSKQILKADYDAIVNDFSAPSESKLTEQQPHGVV